MAGRKTVYNSGLTTPEKIAGINKKNISLLDDFTDYLKSVARADTTIKNYKADLLIFFCWCEDYLDNKYFVELTKREIARFQSHALNDLGWSSNRLRAVKAAISSLSNFIENILDDEIKGFKSIVRKIESPPKQAVREKTVYTEEEIANLLDELVRRKEYDRACFVALAAYSGRRKSELLRFRVDDFTDDKLVCDGALYKSAPIKTKGRAGGKYLQCYTLAKKFKPYFDLWMEDRSNRGIESVWLFPNKEDPSKQMATSTVDGWKDEFTRIGGKDYYPHSQRHGFCTLLSKNGIPDSVIAEIFGWSSMEMCKVYNDRTGDELIGDYFKNGEIAGSKKNTLFDN
ncbi:MAG: site-specific integrase [Clostridia bacterium]|nr:site-specific integrase [Clostridia bacterium]